MSIRERETFVSYKGAMSKGVAMKMRFLMAIAAGLVAHPAYSREDTAQPLELRLDHAALLRLPQGTMTIILGNPKIADITPQKNGLYILTGRLFGSTNLIAQDGNGDTLASYTLRVLPNVDRSQLTVQRGMATELLNCLPRCMPAEAPAAPPTPTTR